MKIEKNICRIVQICNILAKNQHLYKEPEQQSRTQETGVTRLGAEVGQDPNPGDSVFPSTKWDVNIYGL